MCEDGSSCVRLGAGMLAWGWGMGKRGPESAEGSSRALPLGPLGHPATGCPEDDVGRGSQGQGLLRTDRPRVETLRWCSQSEGPVVLRFTGWRRQPWGTSFCQLLCWAGEPSAPLGSLKLLCCYCCYGSLCSIPVLLQDGALVGLAVWRGGEGGERRRSILPGTGHHTSLGLSILSLFMWAVGNRVLGARGAPGLCGPGVVCTLWLLSS